MSSRVKKTNDKNQQILKVLLKEPGNSHCADCKTASHPRWASWNLGIFICIRCSGIHRSMGTHISRVKSVDLDTWTDEQIQSIVKWGNEKANKFWEAKLPNNNHVPDDSKIENFIRTKYDMKKWAASSKVPDPSTLKVDPSSNDVQQQTSPIARQSTSKSDTTSNRRSLNSNLLDLEFGSPVAAPRAAQQQQQQTQPQQSQYVQAQPRPSSTLESLTSTFNQPPPQQRSNQQQHPQQRPLNNRPDLKKSILSLYSTPIASNSTPNFPAHSSLQNQSTASLNGLNFNNTGSSANSWNNNNNTQNQWATSTSATPTNNYNTTSNFSNTSNPLDDDLFKNVWN
ncbi:unnamed protein product [Wickerhamomyces anomalus]